MKLSFRESKTRRYGSAATIDDEFFVVVIVVVVLYTYLT